VIGQIRLLVPRDNDATVRAFRFLYLMNAEVLAGLGIAPRFTFVLSDGRKAERTFAPVSAPAYSRGFGSFRMWPAGRAHARDRAAGTRLSVLAGGRVAYLAYNSALEHVGNDAARLLKLPAKVRRVVVDVRNNPGGDNHTYPILNAFPPRREDTGGAPNLDGDVTPLDLPQTGLRVEIATIWWMKSWLGAHDRPRPRGSPATTRRSPPR
jgi:hypothetical protein